MRIGLLNLMPNKIKTETQIARLLGSTPLQVELTLVRITNQSPATRRAITSSRSTATGGHPVGEVRRLHRHRRAGRDDAVRGGDVLGRAVRDLRLDADQRPSSFNICWGAQAAVHHFHGMPKHPLPAKAFGVYRHRNLAPASPYLRGFSDDFSIPVSRWTEVRREDIPPASGLKVLMESDETGLCLLDDPAHRSLHMFNHLEYDSVHSATSISATSRPASRSRCRATISRTTIRRASPRTAGAATRICCSATGSTRSTRRRRSRWRRSGRRRR